MWGIDFVVHASFLDKHLCQVKSRGFSQSVVEIGFIATFSLLHESSHDFAVDFAGQSGVTCDHHGLGSRRVV